MITAMQDALLPEGVVALPAVDIAARYLLGESGRSAGGDWFDTVTLPDERVALVVGDVAGHGVPAASTMGQLRVVVLSALLAHGHPEPALEAAAAYADVVSEARGATVAIVVVDPGSSSLCYCTAGHPPPLVVGADGSGSFLPATGGGPLGSGTPAPAAAAPFEAGDLVLLYTDGLVVRPGADPVDGRAELRTVVERACREASGPGGAPSAAELACERAMGRLALRTGTCDDAAVLAAQRCTVAAEDLVLDLPALPDTVRVVRLELEAWLARLRLPAIDDLALQQAVGELVSNAVEHAYPAGVRALQTSVRLRAAHTADGYVQVDVVDDGRWAPRAAGSHRGLALASGFVDRLEAVPRDRGTHLRVRHRALRSAGMLTWAGKRRLGGDGETLTVRRAAPGRLEVAGPVDALGVDRLAAEVRRAAYGPVDPLVVDLTDVSLLCSRAVQVLSDARPGAGPIRARVVLRAPADSVAGLVLDLALVPYEDVRPTP